MGILHGFLKTSLDVLQSFRADISLADDRPCMVLFSMSERTYGH